MLRSMTVIPEDTLKPLRGLFVMFIFLATLGGVTPGEAADQAVDEPFWTGHPDVATFTAAHDARIARAQSLLATMRAVQGKRTIENTLRPYDNALLELDAAGSQSSLIENAHPDSALRTAAEEMSQKVSAVYTELSLDRGVYDALAALDLAGADAETKHYVEKTLRDFKLAGVDRDEATREKVKKLREELVEIGQEFSRNIRSDVRTVTVKDAKELDGLPADFIERHKPGPDGTITLTIDYPDAIPVFSYATSDDLRKRMYMEFNNRAHPKNVETLDRMIAKRHELATLLGYPSWAEYITADKMVGSGKNASAFIDKIAGASGEKAKREYATLLARKQKDVPGATHIDAWEANYWNELVRKSEFDFDAQTVRPYFPYASVKRGVLDVTGKLFGVEFRPVKDAPVWDPSVECYEMFENGKLAGRFYLDMHPRKNKYNHAAQFDIRTGVAGRQIPEAALLCNFPGGEAGDPGLMEAGDVRTFFHEFGHLLHTLFAGNHRWVGVGGIRTEHDFVEAPSQMLEEWTWDPKVLASFAKHHQTGEPIPAELVVQMKRASEFGKGIGVRRQMVYARISLSCYDRDPKQVETDRIVKESTERYTMYPFVEGTHMQCAFGHLDGYSAVYYTYMWSLVIAKDLFAQFDKNNLLAPGVAKKYRDTVLAPGGSRPAARLVSDFLGRDFTFDAWQRWLNEETQPAKPVGAKQ
jgi:thimet oligopeptidase